jgi:hypothetical protein
MYIRFETGNNHKEEKTIPKSVIEVNPSLKGMLICRNSYTDHYGQNVYAGEFKTIFVNSVPAVKKELFIVTKWGDGKGSNLRQEIKIIDPENSLAIFNSQHLEEDFDLKNIYHEHVIVGQVTNLLLPRTGRYLVEVYLAGEIKGKTYINVTLG